MAVATLTMNPTVDVAYAVDKIYHSHKMRADEGRYDPGGGGINVARVFVRLGGNARCYYMSGGATGVALDGLLDLHQLVCTRIPIEGATRVSTSVFDRENGREYRFVPKGPAVSEAEWRAALAALGEAQCDYLLASGSLPSGVPENFYAEVAARARERGIRFVLDSSGAALAGGLSGGGLFLIKPSLGELSALVGRELRNDAEIAAAAQGIVARGEAENVAVTLAEKGALLATSEGVTRVPALEVEARSAVGAGDSFLAAMVHALSTGRAMEDAFRYGVAAGAAAVLTPGTDLCRPADIERLFAQMQASQRGRA